MDRQRVFSPSFLLKPQPARAAAFVVIGHPEAGERGHATPGIEQDTENGLIPNAFQRIGLDGGQEAAISACSKTGVREDSLTNLGGLARAAGLYSTTPRIKSESESNLTAARCSLSV